MPDTTKTRILIVEDDADLRRILTCQLESEGFATIRAENGADACKILQETIPDCILLDLMMPVMDGFTLLKRLRTANRTARIPVIVLTASQDDRHRRKSQQFLADAYLGKPYDLQDLTNEIRRRCHLPQPA